MHRGEKVRKRIAPTADVAVIVWNQLFLVVDRERQFLELMDDFELWERLDETLLGLVSGM